MADSPEEIAAANASYLARMERVARGWHHRGWTDPAALLRQLDEQQCDPVEARALSRMREAERLRDGRTTTAEALRWIRENDPRNEAPE
jgi:hypothetical protein